MIQSNIEKIIAQGEGISVEFKEAGKDAVRTLNPNNPWFNGIMDLDNFNPHPKNPNLRRFFTAPGWADEIGSGIRNTKKYLPYYIEKAKPVFIDESLFRTIIPLVHYTMSDFTKEWFEWLELDEKWLPKLTESLKNIEIDGLLKKMSWSEQIEYLQPCWIEKGTELSDKKGTSTSKKGYMSGYTYNHNNKQDNDILDTSPDEKGYMLNEEDRTSSNEKGTKLLNKKMRYIVTILLMFGLPLSIDDLMSVLGYKHKGKFRDNYIKPLESAGFITKTNPDKPRASNQKYIITEKGKRFLTGRDLKKN